MNIGLLLKATPGRLAAVRRLLWWLVPGLILGAAPAVAQLDVSGAYLRIPPPGHPVAAVFLTLRNTGGQALQLVGARADMAEKIEIHTHEHADGMMRMRQLAQLQVPANSEVALEPGGYHLMVYGLSAELVPGDKFALTLLLADGNEVAVLALARRP